MSTELFQRAEVDWIPLVIFVLWALSGLFGNKKRKQRREEEAGEIPPPRQRTEQVERNANTELQEVLREIEHDLGLEPAKKAPQRPQPRAEQPRGPWHAAPSPIKKASRNASALHEESLMPPREAHVHDHGDSSQLRQPREAPSKLASSLLGDLTGGGANLQKAILLQEILGPPVSLRDLD